MAFGFFADPMFLSAQAAISACEKGGQWTRALTLLEQMGQRGAGRLRLESLAVCRSHFAFSNSAVVSDMVDKRFRFKQVCLAYLHTCFIFLRAGYAFTALLSNTRLRRGLPLFRMVSPVSHVLTHGCNICSMVVYATYISCL